MFEDIDLTPLIECDLFSDTPKDIEARKGYTWPEIPSEQTTSANLMQDFERVRKAHKLFDSDLNGRIAVITIEGNVIAAGVTKAEKQQIATWKNIVSIACGRGHIVGLKSDGTVVAAGDNSSGQCNVRRLENIVLIAANHSCTYALSRDGVLYGIGNLYAGEIKNTYWEDSRLKNARCIYPRIASTSVLLNDGTMWYGRFRNQYEPQVLPWKSLIAIGGEFCSRHIGEGEEIGLYRSGHICLESKTVTKYERVWSKEAYQYITKWSNIIDIGISNEVYLGVHFNGRLLYQGAMPKFRYPNLKNWQNVLAISFSSDAIWGLTRDGKILFDGGWDYSKGMNSVNRLYDPETYKKLENICLFKDIDTRESECKMIKEVKKELLEQPWHAFKKKTELRQRVKTFEQEYGVL